jgi:hypothetical protein
MKNKEKISRAKMAYAEARAAAERAVLVKTAHKKTIIKFRGKIK